MRYLVIPTTAAKAYGFDESLHLTRGDMMCVNEKEVMMNPRLAGTLADRASALGSPLYSSDEAVQLMDRHSKKS